MDELYPNSTGSSGEKCLNQLAEQKVFLDNSPKAANSRQIRE